MVTLKFDKKDVDSIKNPNIKTLTNLVLENFIQSENEPLKEGSIKTVTIDLDNDSARKALLILFEHFNSELK